MNEEANLNLYNVIIEFYEFCVTVLIIMAKTNDKQRTAPISRGPEAPKLSSDTNSKNSGKKNKPEKQK